jgi:carbonic anhydrase
VRPSVVTLLNGRRDIDQDALIRDAVRANVRASVNQLRHGSELLERLILETGLLVVGAEYSLETGVVDFFENVPDAAQPGLFSRSPT